MRNGSHASDRATRRTQQDILREQMALRQQGKSVPIDWDSVPEPPPGVWPKKPCSSSFCWSHNPASDAKIDIPWTEFQFDTRTRSRLQSQCRTCMTVAKLPIAAKTQAIAAMQTPIGPPVEIKVPEVHSVADQAEPPQKVVQEAIASVRPITPKEPPRLMPQLAPLLSSPLMVFTDQDGDRWGMPFVQGPLIELGKVGSDTVRVHLPFQPADAPQTLTTVGDEAQALERHVRLLVASFKQCDATAVEEAIMLWEQEQIARLDAERLLETVRGEMQARIGAVTAELQAAQAQAEDAEKKRLAATRSLTKVEADRRRLEAELKQLSSGDQLGKLVDAQAEVQRLTEYANRLAGENERLNGKLVEARPQRDAARRKLARYEPETTIGDATPELQIALAAAPR